MRGDNLRGYYSVFLVDILQYIPEKSPHRPQGSMHGVFAATSPSSQVLITEMWVPTMKYCTVVPSNRLSIHTATRTGLKSMVLSRKSKK